jgi:CheY-like chemotaxis protein
VLAEIKTGEDLKRVPVVVLAASQADEDILKAFGSPPTAHCQARRCTQLHDSYEVEWSSNSPS